jgi:hypothetical protein
MLQEEVRELAGEKYKREGLAGHNRWGAQRVSRGGLNCTSAGRVKTGQFYC